jgi:hypothetical protein
MVVNVIFDVITGSASGNDGDFNDRLNHRYTAVVFAFCAVFAMSTQLIGNPIDCWVPAENHPAWQMYANQICFVNKTYFIDPDHHVAIARRDGDQVFVDFYQWYPVLLVLMGALFYAPQMFWTGMLGSYEIDMNKMVNTVDNCELVLKPEDRTAKLKDLAGFLDKHLSAMVKLSDLNKKMSPVGKVFFKCCNRNSGAKMGVYYFGVKIGMFINAFAQLLFLDVIIGPGTWLWGFEVIGCILSGQPWTNTWRFPMTTFCDYQYHSTIGEINSQTIECVLGVNLYNEKIFLFVWGWLWFMVIMNALSIMNWFNQLFNGNNRYRWIETYILMGNKSKGPDDVTYNQHDPKSNKNLAKFVKSHLKPDGVFMLRLISANTTGINMTELICNLWDLFIEKKLSPLPEAPESKLDEVDA